MPDETYRCLKLPSQPIMDKTRCVARGVKPELYDECIGCVHTIQRKAITNPNTDRRLDCNPTHPRI